MFHRNILHHLRYWALVLNAVISKGKSCRSAPLSLKFWHLWIQPTGNQKEKRKTKIVCVLLFLLTAETRYLMLKVRKGKSQQKSSL